MKNGSFKWLLSRKSTLEEEFQQLGRKVIAELSPVANVVVGRCSRYTFFRVFNPLLVLAISSAWSFAEFWMSLWMLSRNALTKKLPIQ